MRSFQLDKKFHFIELNKLLKITSLASSGGEANQLITEGCIKVNGVCEMQKRKKLRKGDVVEMNGEVVEII